MAYKFLSEGLKGMYAHTLDSFVWQSNSALLCVVYMGEEWRRTQYINKYILCLVMKMSLMLCCIIIYVSFVSAAYSAVYDWHVLLLCMSQRW